MLTRFTITRCLMIACLVLLTSCATFFQSYWNHRYGEAKPLEYQAAVVHSAIDYDREVKPIIEQRCTVCHGCYDAPCQLKLDSLQGLLRGASTEKVYDGTRLLGATMTRLFEDAHTTEEWRHKNFFAVLNERKQDAQTNIDAGVMARLLTLKQQHPLPNTSILPDSFSFELNRSEVCPRLETLEAYERNFPLWGMPYALPALTTKEHNTLMSWLAAGAAPSPEKQPNKQLQKRIKEWEIFLNGDSLKERVVNRYIYEHLFLAAIYFEEMPNLHFKLIRSSTPPGTPIQRITTTRPFDDPQVARVYYRFWQDPTSIVAKNHMPYLLNKARRERIEALFYQVDYTISTEPSYAPETAANPFATFAELPVGSRYRFMLDEAQFTISNFIKGPVCRGQIALSVIQDQFWVLFVSPELMSTKEDAVFLAKNSQHLQMPASEGNTLLSLGSWLTYSELQKKYLRAKADYVSEKVERQGPINLNMLWDGDKNNDNAALTIFRHSDSASVVKGLVGKNPKTAWVIGYPVLERIHYLLVAGFDVYGNVSHQLLSRLYMDFLRMEGEVTFLDMLPAPERETELDYWYLGAEQKVHQYLDLYQSNIVLKNTIAYQTDNPKQELFALIKQTLKPVLSSKYDPFEPSIAPLTLKNFTALENLIGKPLTLLPQQTIIHIPELGFYSLLHNSAYKNMSSLFNEEARRTPDDDSVTFVRGIIGAYPNAFMQVNEAELTQFIAQIASLNSEADYQALRDRFGIRRSDPRFWAFSDLLHDQYFQMQPNEAGLLDYNRLDNR